MNTICGIDEAGRGPVIGPLVIAGVTINESDEKKLKNLKVTDSKLIPPEKREALFDKIKAIVSDYKIIIVEPAEIDNAVGGSNGLNLNKLEAQKSVEIINELKPDTAIVDSPSNNVKAYKEYLREFLNDKQTKLIVEHKADLNYAAASAASILAKVTRDRAIKDLQKKVGANFGSGYPSDPKTVDFLKEHYKTHEDIFRKSWASYKNIIERKKQSTLDSFSEYVADENNVHAEKIKKLKDLGYSNIETKTEHEAKRMKGSTTVIFYKKGTILVQGKQEEKERIEKLLNIKKKK